MGIPSPALERLSRNLTNRKKTEEMLHTISSRLQPLLAWLSQALKEAQGNATGAFSMVVDPVMVCGWDECNRIRRLRRRSVDRSRWACYIFVAMIVMTAIATCPVDGAGRTVRVGVYQNEPKIFMDEKGHASGFFIDLLEEIAAREGWTLVYVQCNWAECLAALDEGRIDLMPDVAYSLERDEKYDFHHMPVTESWSQVYANPRVQVNGINDLDSRRVAVLKGSIQQTVFEQYMHGFGFEVTIVSTESLEEAFKLAADGSADAAIANNFFGNYFYQSYGLVKTPIVFNAVTLYYATAQGHNHDLLEAIDRHLGAWLTEANSPYYTTLSRWTEKTPVYRVPQSIYWVIGITGGLLVVAVGMVFLLRGQVRARTKHLEQTDKELQERLHELSSLYNASQIFSHHLDPEIIGQRLIGTIEQFLGYEYCAVMSIDEKTGELVPLALSDQGRGPEFVSQDKEYVRSKGLHIGNGIVGWVAQHGKAVRLGDVSHDSRYFALRENIRSELCVPIIVGNKVIGVLNIETGKPYAYDEDDERILTALSASAGVALENAKLYERMQGYATELEVRVAERTRELKEANVKLQELDRLKSMFIASMSHELRTPLNSIIGFTGIILQGMTGDINEEQEKQLSIVRESARHLLSLINDIIDLSKIEAGQVEPTIKEFDLPSILKEVYKSFLPSAEEKKLALHISTPQSLFVRSDERRVKQVIINLLGNAIKFTDKGEIDVNVSTEGKNVVISVKDTGRGIKEEDMGKLFVAFRQIHVEDLPIKEGTGLGLYLSRKIATLLGGEISAESEFGSGSTFIFSLPKVYGEEKK